MTEKTTSVGGSGSWTFGSPSVLAMYYRTPGSLDRVVADMKECMPCYYRLTGGHGSGAEDLTEAESLFSREILPLFRFPSSGQSWPLSIKSSGACCSVRIFSKCGWPFLLETGNGFRN